MDKSFWNGKKVLITGHTSFKGSWLCKVLEIVGAQLIGYGLQPSAQHNLYDLCNLDIHSINGDIRDFDNLSKTIKQTKPEVIIHLAAQPLVRDSYQKPYLTYEVNVLGTLNVLECIRLDTGVKSFINITTNLSGHDPYSSSKACSELITSSYDHSFFKEQKISVSTMRSGNVIGGGDFSPNRLIPDCARALAKGEAIEIRNPNAVRTYLHVLDAVFAYLDIAQKQYNNLSYAGTHDVGQKKGESITSGELASLFCNAWNGHNQADNPQQWGIKRAIKETALWYSAYFNGKNVEEVMNQQINERIIV